MGIATCIIDKTLQKIIDFFIVFVYNMVNNIKRSVPIYTFTQPVKNRRMRNNHITAGASPNVIRFSGI